METDSGNANAAFNRSSLNKPLPSLPHPYFEYLFADADETSKDIKPREGNAHIDPVKRDSNGFSVPGRPASSYNSFDNLSFDNDGGDGGKGTCFDPHAPASLIPSIDMVLDDAPSPPSPGPITPPYHLTPDVNVDLSAFSQFVFHQANVPFNCRGMFIALLLMRRF